MDNSQTLLEGSSDMEKGAYIGVIASLATADRQATADEIEYLSALCKAANLSQEQTEAVVKAATEISADDVKNCLDVLKNSELRFSLVADLIAFAKSDNTYSEQEQQTVQKMAEYLGVDQKQYSLLGNFATKATAAQTPPEEMAKPDFLSSLGLKDKLQSAGINGNTLLKGMLGIAAPLIISKMLSGRNRNSYGGGFGGGLLGGGLMGGGLGSIISMINGGRGGGMGSLGGIFGNIFGGRRGW